MESVADGSRGSLIICPGGNYQFLVPHEGLPVAEFFAKQGFRAMVLRYRLLPKYDFDDMQQDLVSAAAMLRNKGPVCAMGFSAGGHLVASTVAKHGVQVLDAQALIYPCIDGSDWASEETCGFWARPWAAVMTSKNAFERGRVFNPPVGPYLGDQALRLRRAFW